MEAIDEVHVYVQYYERTMPQRCKRERRVRKGAWTTVSIPRTEEADAPVAMRVTKGCDEVRDYRLWRGSLYGPCPYPDAVLRDQILSVGYCRKPMPAPSGFEGDEEEEGAWLPYWSLDFEEWSFEAMMGALAQWIDGYLLVGDRLWQREEEPRYAVRISFGGKRVVEVDPRGHFNALEPDALPRADGTLFGKIEVLIPEAVAAPFNIESLGLTTSRTLIRQTENNLEGIEKILGCDGKNCNERCMYLREKQCMLAAMRQTLRAIDESRDALTADIADRASRGFGRSGDRQGARSGSPEAPAAPFLRA